MATHESSNDQNWQKRKRICALTDLPIQYQATTLDGIVPDIPGHENLPPLQLASYSTIPPNSLPKIFQQIYRHMILRRTVDGKEVNNYKGLDRAVKYFEGGDISQIVAAQIDDSVEYIRGFCLASMKKAKYKVYICIEDKQNVCFAYCKCPIGLAQSYSHIGGLLFHLHHLHLHEVLKSYSATSKQCMWNVPRPIKMEWNFAKPKLQESGEIEHWTTD